MLRRQGWNLDQIAERFDVSRERVRQILGAHGGPDSRDVAAARRRRVQQEAEACIDELLALWRAGEQLGTATPQAAQTCLPQRQCATASAAGARSRRNSQPSVSPLALPASACAAHPLHEADPTR